MPGDLTIWNDFRTGKDYALSYIYCHQVERLYRYGRKFTRDEALIKDTIQELFYHLIRSRSSLGETNNISFYLMSAFKHQIIRSIQTDKHFETKVEPDNSYELSIAYSCEDELIDKEIESQKTDAVRRILGTISPKQREILYYRYSCNYSYDEICVLMSIRYDSARKMIFRALTTLRMQLDSKDLILLFLFKK